MQHAQNGSLTHMSRALPVAPAGADPSSLGLLESEGRLPPFTHFGADVNQPGVLREVAAQISYQREIILVCGDGSAYASPTALNTVIQFYAMRLRHVLYVSDSRRSCENLRAGLPGLACVWSSRITTARPNHTGICVKKYFDMRFYFYDIRKEMVARLAVDEGMNVLQTDTDVAWFSNPYPQLKGGSLARANLIAQHDEPFVNAGVFYAQNIKPDGGAAWLLKETARRVHTFLYHPEEVRRVVKWAKPPYFANADEQTLMNDVLVSSICNASVYLWSTAMFEARYGGANRGRYCPDGIEGPGHRPCLERFPGWGALPEAAEQKRLLRHAHALATRVPEPGNKKGGRELYPLHVPGSAAPAAAWYARAPSSLFSHSGGLFTRYRGALTGAAERGKAPDLAADAAEARRGARPLSLATRRPEHIGSSMVHLAGVRTGAWSRRTILRAYGFWHRAADSLMGAQMGWGSKSNGALRVYRANSVGAPTRRELDTLAANLVTLGALTGRTPVAAAWPKWSSWRCRSGPPRAAPTTASEGLRPPSALVRRVPSALTSLTSPRRRGS